MDRRTVEEFIRSNKLGWRLIGLNKVVRSVKQAAEALGVPESNIIKTIIAIDNSRTYACIIPGDRKLDLDKLSRLVGGSPRIAKPREVLERTGYKVGGVPPIALPEDVIVIMDERVLKMEKAIGGGGDEYSLLEFTPRDLLKIRNVLVADISH